MQMPTRISPTNWAGKGEIVEAIAHCRAALAIQPNYVEAHNNLGILLAQKGEAAEAIAQFRKALELRPDYPVAGLRLALFRKGDFRRRPGLP